jgi:hypothetical protein
VSVPAAPGSIPSLLLQAVSTDDGPDGERLTPTTWVQRLSTAGGAAPATPCAPGETRGVFYTADYHFWKAKGIVE